MRRAKVKSEITEKKTRKYMNTAYNLHALHI